MRESEIDFTQRLERELGRRNKQISLYQIQMRVREMHRQEWRVTDSSYQIQMSLVVEVMRKEWKGKRDAMRVR